LPPVNLNLREAMSLLLLVHRLSEQIQFPFRRLAKLAALKIENKMPFKIRQYCNMALQHISIKANSQEDYGTLDGIFAQLLTAILGKRIVSVQYYLPHEQKNVAVDLSPYHLMYNDKGWYVLGKSSLRNGFHTLKLSRIGEVDISDKRFIEDEKFNLSEQLGRVWSMAYEGKLYDVKLKFLPRIAHSAAEVKWHSTQKETFMNDGSAIIEFSIDGLDEIIWWILGYGDQVKVLAPEVLRQRIIKIAQSTMKQNAQYLST
jgi:predicted DNA-binding transcriptional regulator YafY